MGSDWFVGVGRRYFSLRVRLSGILGKERDIYLIKILRKETDIIIKIILLKYRVTK